MTYSLIRAPARQPVRQSFNVGGSFGGGVEKREKKPLIRCHSHFLIRAPASPKLGGGWNEKVVCFAMTAAMLVPLTAFAYASPGKPSGFVNDFAGMLTLAEARGLEAKLAAFEKGTGSEIAVVTVPTLGGDAVENFAVKLFEEWGIGKKDEDNGALILIAQDSHDIRIEVGYGLEPVLTDAQSYWLIQNVMIPAFREGKYYAGVDGAVDRIIAAVGGLPAQAGEVIPSLERGRPQGGISMDWFWLILFLPLWLGSILGRSKSWWAGGVIGGVAGVIIGLVKGFLYTGIVSLAFLVPIGLLFDYFVSKSYGKFKSKGRTPPWWIGGGWFGGRGGLGGGGFGGFGGGGSGGGGASGRW